MTGKGIYWFVFAVLASAVNAVGDSTFLSASKISFPLYDYSKSQLAAVVRIDDFRHDHQRKGFFKIGFMPLIVVSNVSVQIHSQESFARNIASFARKIEANPNSFPVEVRNFELVSEAKPILTAAVARPRADHGWELRAVEFTGAGGLQKAARAEIKFLPEGPELHFGNSNRLKIFPLNR